VAQIAAYSCAFFIGWISYLDLFLDAKRRQQGDFEPADLVVLAQKP